MAQVLIRGSNDVGSATAHRLVREGFAVLIHDVPAPAVARRRMSFADALFDGHAILEGMTARRVEQIGELNTRQGVVTVCSLALPDILFAWRPDVLVDARMRKRLVPEPQRELAPLVIGIGPNFTVNDQVDLAVESSYGDTLGCVITTGSPLPLAGEPRAVHGYGRERFVYAARAAVFRTRLKIGDIVRAGDLLAELDAEKHRAPIGGAILGLVRDNVPVEQGTKIIEVDPRGEAAKLDGIGERPRRIAEGVLSALRSVLSERLLREGCRPPAAIHRPNSAL